MKTTNFLARNGFSPKNMSEFRHTYAQHTSKYALLSYFCDNISHANAASLVRKLHSRKHTIVACAGVKVEKVHCFRRQNSALTFGFLHYFRMPFNAFHRFLQCCMPLLKRFCFAKVTSRERFIFAMCQSTNAHQKCKYTVHILKRLVQ